LCVLDGVPLVELFRAQPQLAFRLLRMLVEEQQRADERIAQLGHLGGPQRLGCLLLDIFDRLRSRGMTADTSCAFPLQRQQLADALGLSRTHLIRSLAELQKAGLATIANNTLGVLDRGRLAAFSGYDRTARAGGLALL
jgi:CRP-like cAMP-binding protein